MLLLLDILAFMFGLFSQNYVLSIEYVIACRMISLALVADCGVTVVGERVLEVENV